MNRKARFIHFFALVALVANMFAPLITMETALAAELARFQTQPGVTYDIADDPGDGNDAGTTEEPQNPPTNGGDDGGVPGQPGNGGSNGGLKRRCRTPSQWR